jgi:bifunctional non-homologous end joining protein LigD
MLAMTGGTARDSWDGFALEVKWDGCRAQARIDREDISLRTRHGRACTSEFPELEEFGDAVSAQRVILDCELVCLAADGLPDFAAVRARLGSRPRSVAAGAVRRPATLIVFDVLHLDGEAVWRQPYEQRRALLGELLEDGPRWRVPRYFVGEECAPVFAATREQGVEGVVAKRLGSVYSPGHRSRDWVKFKHRRRETFRVTGWRERDGQLPEFFLAREAGGRLRPAGTVALGLDTGRREQLLDALRAHERSGRGGAARRCEPVVQVIADCHGRPEGPVRDAVLREVRLSSTDLAD